MSTVASGKDITKLSLPLLGIMVGAQMGGQNVSNIALVDVSKALGLVGNTQVIAGVITTIMLAATVISSGVVADRFGRRRVLMVGLTAVTVSNILTMLAFAPWMYILLRAITGVGIGIILGSTFAFVFNVARPERLAAAIGIYTATTTSTMIVVSVVGGSLTALHWQLAFLLTPLLSVVCLALVPKNLPPIPTVTEHAADLLGHALLIFGISCGLLGVVIAAAGLTAAPITLMAVGVLLVAAFAVAEHRSVDPMFPIHIFRNKLFLAAAIIGITITFVNSGLGLQTSNLWQYILKLTTFDVVLAQIPGIALSVLAPITVGRLLSAGKLTPRAVITMGMTVMAVAALSLVFVTPESGVWMFIVPITLLFGSVAMVVVVYGQMIMRAAPVGKFGPVTGSRTAILQIGTSLGTSLMLITMNNLTAGGVTNKLLATGLPASEVDQGIGYIAAYVASGTQAASQLAQEAFSDAKVSYLHAYNVIAGACCLICLGVLVVALLLIRSHGKAAEVA